MGFTRNDPFPGTDYSQYLTWVPVNLPDGRVVYEIPNFPGYVLDPVASNATGNKVIRPNPKGAIADQKKQQDALDKAQKQQSFNQSPVGQLLPVAGTIGGIYAANQLANMGSSAPSIPSVGASVPTPPVAPNLGSSAAQNFVGGSSGADGIYQVGTNADGSILMSDGSTQFANGLGQWGQAPGAVGQTLGAAAAAKGLYDSYNAFQKNGEGIRTGATQLGAGVGTMVAGPLGTVAGAAIGNTLGYGLQGKGWKNDAALLLASGGMAAPYVLARHLGWDGMHKTTRQRQSEVSDRLLEEAGDDAIAKQYVEGMRGQFAAPPPDKSKPFAGKYGSWDEYQAGGLEANDLTGVQGNMDAFGVKGWANLTQDQRVKATQALIDAGQYYSKDGGVRVKDKDESKKIIDTVLGLNVPPPSSLGKAAAQGTVKAR